MEDNYEKTIKLEKSMNGKLGKTKENWGNCWENEEIAGRKLWKNRRNAGTGLKKRHEMEARQSFEKARNIEASILKKTKDPKLNGEQRPLGFGARRFARGWGVMPRKEWRRVAKNGGKWRNRLKKLLKWRKKMNCKLGKTKENWGNCWENEEIAGRKLWKNRRKTQEKAWKKGMKWRKGKALKKLGT